MTPVDVLRALQATTKRGEKDQILIDAWMRGCTEFFAGAKLAYDALMPFHVQKVAKLEDDVPSGTLTFADFADLAGRLHRREITGNAARDAIHAAAARCDSVTWNEWFRRILLKDLRAGVEESSINSVIDKLSDAHPEIQEYHIPVFQCQLAKPSEHNEGHMRGRKMQDFKLDGVRLLTFLDKRTGTVHQRTRNGLLNENFPHITKALTPLVERLPCSIALEGEIVTETFQDLMTLVRRKEKLNSENAKLALFDIVPWTWEEFFKPGNEHPMKQRERHHALCGLIPEFIALTGGRPGSTGGFVYVLEKQNIDLDTPEGQAALDDLKVQAGKLKLEGVMIKDPDAPYRNKRTSAWLKSKPFIEVTLEIVGMKGGTGKYEGMMGAIFAFGVEDGKAILTRCGSGFSDDERREFVAQGGFRGFLGEFRADLISKPSKAQPLIERMRDICMDENKVKPSHAEMEALAQRLGLDNGVELHSLRFPRWKGLRGTRPGEKL